MRQPNWFDKALSKALERATAEEAIEIVAKNPRVIKAVKQSLDDHDKNARKPGWRGPTRSQAVRSAIADVLQSLD